jgi:uncharacterized membrane protein YbhN (UPF0104 family)
MIAASFSIIYLAVKFIELLIRIMKGEKIEWRATYSYKQVIKVCLNSVIITSLISIYIYHVTESLEVSISLFVIFIVFIISGTIRSLLTEQHIKGSGGRRDD